MARRRLIAGPRTRSPVSPFLASGWRDPSEPTIPADNGVSPDRQRPLKLSMNEPTGAFLPLILPPGAAGWIMTRHSDTWRIAPPSSRPTSSTNSGAPSWATSTSPTRYFHASVIAASRSASRGHRCANRVSSIDASGLASLGAGAAQRSTRHRPTPQSRKHFQENRAANYGPAQAVKVAPASKLGNLPSCRCSQKQYKGTGSQRQYRLYGVFAFYAPTLLAVSLRQNRYRILYLYINSNSSEEKPLLLQSDPSLIISPDMSILPVLNGLTIK